MTHSGVNLFKALLFCFALMTSVSGYSQEKKYPSLLWKISGNDMSKPSYLYGTMHVSKKLAYYLSDQFYKSIKSVDVVGLETNPAEWVEQMEKYNLIRSFNGEQGYYRRSFRNFYSDAFKLDIPVNRAYHGLLAIDPEIINSLLFRSGYTGENFEENTYVDLFIYQAGAKWDKKIVSLEDFKTSMVKGKLAYMPDVDEEEMDFDYYSGGYMTQELIENAYRIGDLDAIDSLYKYANKSKNFQKYLIDDRNLLFVNSMDSIMKAKQSIFSGVGAAHLPGENGVIELLRQRGYIVEPIIQEMSNRDSKTKDKLEHTFKPVIQAKQYAEDSLFSFSAPGKLIDIVGDNYASFHLHADMTNAAYYTIARVKSFAPLMGYNMDKMKMKIDSMLYEFIPGKIISNKEIKNFPGVPGYDIINQTRKGDMQRYNIFVTDLEVIIFKLGGKFDYVKSNDAKQFFNSISFNPKSAAYTTFSPATGGFEVSVPSQRYFEKTDMAPEKGISEFLNAYDNEKNIFYGITHSIYNDVNYIESDSFELEFLSKKLLDEFRYKENVKKEMIQANFPAIQFSGENSKTNQKFYGRIYIKGIHYYMIYALGEIKSDYPKRFFDSFKLSDFNYVNRFEVITDESMFFSAKDETSDIFKNVVDDEANAEYDNLLKQKKKKDPDTSYEESVLDKYYFSYSSHERVSIDYRKFNDYDYRDKNTFWPEVKKRVKNSSSVLISNEKMSEADGVSRYEFLATDSGSVRGIQYSCMIKNGVYYELKTPLDTRIGTSGWTNDFIESFKPSDTLIGSDIFENKFKNLIADLQSSDSAKSANAKASLSEISFEEIYTDDFIKLINSPEFKNIPQESKAQILSKGGYLKSEKIIEPYKKLYKQYPDSLFLQLSIIEGLGKLKNTKSYAAAFGLLVEDTPLIGEESEVQDMFEVFYDSLELCRQFFPGIFALTKFQEYKNPVYNLLASLVENKVINHTLYGQYTKDLVIEANYELKRFNYSQKDEKDYESFSFDAGNDAENLARIMQFEHNKRGNYFPFLNYKREVMMNYVILLAPYYKSDESAKNFFDKVSKIKNDGVLLAVHAELLKNGITANDTIWKYLAGKNETRIRLYQRLEKIKRTDEFPKEYNSQEQFCEAFVSNKINKKYDYEDSKKDKKEKISLIKTMDVQNNKEKGKMYIYQREETSNKSERWAVVFVKENKTITADMDMIKESMVLEKNKSKDEYYHEISENFSIRHRKRAGISFNFEYPLYDHY